ncbi:hypothetical protein ATKI12_6943 [Kitasatospora sp. Ki12]
MLHGGALLVSDQLTGLIQGRVFGGTSGAGARASTGSIGVGGWTSPPHVTYGVAQFEEAGDFGQVARQRRRQILHPLSWSDVSGTVGHEHLSDNKLVRH